MAELAYSRADVKNFIDYCEKLGLDVIPLQQTFGHVEYILRHYKYAELREDPKDFSQVCPSELAKDSSLFSGLIKDMISRHTSPYVHIGGDETFLLGHCPKCQKKVAEEGLSKLYFDYLKMICDIVVGLGKKPVLWADIALKYPEYIQLLPKGTVFVDWNYGWSLDRFGDHKKLLASGYEVWGAAAIRSDPDNFYLEKWKKHFDNISTFIPESRYLQVLQIEAEMNTDEYTMASKEKFHTRSMHLKNKSQDLNQKFADLDKDFLYASEISKENDQRNYKLDELLGKTSTPSWDPVVKTNEGYIKGLTENGIAVFKGIPYARPPVGNQRFMPPVQHTPWTDTLNTVQFGSSAMQPSGANPSGSEDCLYLNLYTPKTDDRKRPVVVWVHGGSMTNGSGKGMNGHAFADKDDMVTITINYRLGALGFLDMSDIGKKYAQSGNLGLLDVIAALKWVHENIAAFGVDHNDPAFPSPVFILR